MWIETIWAWNLGRCLWWGTRLITAKWVRLINDEEGSLASSWWSSLLSKEHLDGVVIVEGDRFIFEPYMYTMYFFQCVARYCPDLSRQLTEPAILVVSPQVFAFKENIMGVHIPISWLFPCHSIHFISLTKHENHEMGGIGFCSCRCLTMVKPYADKPIIECYFVFSRI